MLKKSNSVSFDQKVIEYFYSDIFCYSVLHFYSVGAYLASAEGNCAGLQSGNVSYYCKSWEILSLLS